MMELPSEEPAEEDALLLEEDRGSLAGLLTGVGGAVVATRGTVSAPRLSRGRSVARLPPTLPPSGEDVAPWGGTGTGRDAPVAFTRRTDPAERTTPAGKDPATAKALAIPSQTRQSSLKRMVVSPHHPQGLGWGRGRVARGGTAK